MKILFMGTPEFAVPSLKALRESHEVVAVVTQPDKPVGRGKKLQAPPVKIYAEENKIPVLQPEKINNPDMVRQLKAYSADIFVVVAYGQILSGDILEIPPLGSINVHGSLLPKYRGASPIHRALIDGEKTTGVTIMYMDKKLDAGDMILKNVLEVSDTDDLISLHLKMAELGAGTLMEALSQMERGVSAREKQDDAKASYAGMIEKKMGDINWENSSESIINLIRGLVGWPCAYSTLESGGEIIKIWRAEKSEADFKGQPGEIVELSKTGGITVKTGDGAILLREIQARGGKRMSAPDFLRGHKINVGDVFKQE